MRFRVILLAALSLTATSLLRSDAIVITRAMLASTIAEIFVEHDSIFVDLEIGASDIPAFRNAMPNEVYEALGLDPEPWADRLDRFFTEDFVITDGRAPLQGDIVGLLARDRIKRDEVTGEPIVLGADEEAERVIELRLAYGLDRTPAQLTFAPPRVDKTGAANIGFITYHRNLPVNDYRYLSQPETVNLDWDDPWFSEFDNRNLRRQYFAPISAFLYVEPYEVRKEIVFRPKDLEAWVDLDLAGRDTIRAEDQEALKQRVVDFLFKQAPLTIDGRRVDGLFDRAHFIYRNLRTSGVIEPAEDLDVIQATMGVIFVYPVDSLPNDVTMTWDLFTDRIPLVPTTATDEAGSLPYILSDGDNVLRWQNFLTNPTSQALVDVSAPPRNRFVFLIGMVLATVGIAVLGYKQRRAVIERRLPGGPVIVAALGLIALIGFSFPRAVGSGVSDDQAEAVVHGLLRNVYRAFDFRDEGRIYDALEESTTGDLLTEVYLETQRSLELANQGGARAKVKEVDILDGDYSSVPGGGFVSHMTWRVMGSVGHWGHIHQRVNQYEARITVEVVDGRWKITGLELLEETRV